MTSAVWRIEILAKSPNFGDFAKNPNHHFALVQHHGRVRLVDVVLGQLSVFLNSFSSSVRFLLNFGRRPSQNPQKLTLAALKFGVGNVKNRRFQLGLVRFLPGFYWNTHREPLNTTTKGFGLKPRRSTQVVSRPKSVSRQFQLVERAVHVHCPCRCHFISKSMHA